MGESELAHSLVSLCKSKKRLLEAHADGSIKDYDLPLFLGHRGLGFFSAFLVSEKVQVVSRSNKKEQCTWEGTLGETFLLKQDSDFVNGQLDSGTKVICYLMGDHQEVLDTQWLRNVLKSRCRLNMSFPVSLYVEELGTWENLVEEKPLWRRKAADVAPQQYNML